MEKVQDFIDMIGDKVANMAKSDLVEGVPVSLGKFTIVPISQVSVGFGGGGGGGEGQDMHSHHGLHSHGKNKNSSCGNGNGTGKGSGGGGGGGGQVRPVAVAVFSEDNVEVLTIPERECVFNKIFEKVPDLMDKIKK